MATIPYEGQDGSMMEGNEGVRRKYLLELLEKEKQKEENKHLSYLTIQILTPELHELDMGSHHTVVTPSGDLDIQPR